MTSATEQKDWRAMYEAYFGPMDAEVASIMASEIRRLNPSRGQVIEAIRQLGAGDHDKRMKPRAGEIIRQIRNIMQSGPQTTTRNQCGCDGTGWLCISEAAYLRQFGKPRRPGNTRFQTFAVACHLCQKGQAFRQAQVEARDGDDTGMFTASDVRGLWSAETDLRATGEVW